MVKLYLEKDNVCYVNKKANAFLVILTAIFMSFDAKADLAEALECHKNLRDKTCSNLLIGHIDALYSFNLYCPDGNTSYEFLQQAWAREVKKENDLLRLGTSNSMLTTIQRLNLGCKKLK